ncbi:hypothetical protein LTR85_006238 [Meristemomyces frigidus]|nr:hypothetical protein LTR85_006238 [Meristemomyces frigidus]
MSGKGESKRQLQSHLTTIALHNKYGSLVRIAPNVVSISDPSEIPKIYNIKGNFTKTAFYPIWSMSWKKVPQMNLFSNRDEGEHREYKKKVANAYTLESLLKMEPSIDDCSKLFLTRLGEFADRNEAVDLGEWLQYYAFDVVGEVTFDKKLGFIEKGGDVDGMIAAIEGLLVYATQIGQIPEAHPFLLGNPLFPILLPQMETWNSVLNFTLKAINARTKMSRDGELELEGGRDGNDMLTRWAAAKAFDPLKMSTRDVIVSLSTNVLAGSDTTAIALRAILYFLMKNPAKMEKLKKEIEDADIAGKLSNPISDKAARTELPYLNADIPGGTIVGINAWALHYDPDVFPNPEAFEPER